VKRSLVLTVLLAVAAVGSVLAYQAVSSDRRYRALIARGDRALRTEQTYGAIEAYSGAIALRPDSMLAHLRRAEAYQRRNELDAAVRDFRAAAGLDPTVARPLNELGDALLQAQRYEPAAEAYEASLRLDERAPRVVYKLALARYWSGNLDGSLAAANQAIRLNDHMADAYYLLGLCLRGQQRPVDAARAFERAIERSPGMIPAREELADLDAALGRPEDQLKQLEAVAALDREHVERQVAVGLAHARAGHPNLAVLTLGAALERTPNEPAVYAALGRVWLDVAISRNDQVALRKALEALGRAASIRETTSEALTLYGRALLRDGQAAAAEAALKQAIGRFPVEPAACLAYAAAAERAGQLDAARQALVDYGALAGEEPGFAERAARIARLSLRLNDAPTAVRWLQRASAASPSDVDLLAALAAAQQKAGDPVGARETIRRAQSQDPANQAVAALARRIR
jgi:tetratricopeptide (TPR) repeat protein